LTDIALDRPGADFAALRSVLIAFGNMSGAVRAGHDYDRLARLTDSELAELGLSRADLPEVVLRRHLG